MRSVVPNYDSVYPFDPAITTWKFLRHCPELVALAAAIGRFQKVHLMVVCDPGLGLLSQGRDTGSRSKNTLNERQPFFAAQASAQIFGSYVAYDE